MSELIRVARGLSQDRQRRLEWELLELDSRMEALKLDKRPVRSELERLSRRKEAVKRELGRV